MCFSTEADVVAGVILLPVGLVALREVRRVREIPFAALPMLFASHQLTEALVWAGADGSVPAGVQGTAATLYVLFALVVLPTLMPLSVLLLEPRGARLRLVPFVAIGAAVSTYLAGAVMDGPVRVDVHPHALWCVFAALTSVLVLRHMWLRRRLPDPHRLHGRPMATSW